jgi:hypothetical protein
MGNIRKSYTARDKLKIITYAEAHGNRAAGREYDVGESNIMTFTTMMKTTHHYLFYVICIIFSKKMTPRKNLMCFKRQ